jgi:hypothetical protein
MRALLQLVARLGAELAAILWRGRADWGRGAFRAPRRRRVVPELVQPDHPNCRCAPAMIRRRTVRSTQPPAERSLKGGRRK